MDLNKLKKIRKQFQRLFIDRFDRHKVNPNEMKLKIIFDINRYTI